MSNPTVGPPIFTAKHDPKLMEASIKKAEDFYRWDSQLTQADRRQLASYFWQKMTIFPLMGLPIMWGFIVAPNYLKKRNILNPKKSYRLVQFGLGFMGLGVGFQFSGAVSSVIHMQLLKQNQPAYNAYSALRRYPPQLGTRYFSLTAQDPTMALKNPDTIDWKSNPLFPIVLVMNQKVVDRVKKAENERIDRYRAMQQANTQQEISRRNTPKSSDGISDSEPPLTGTSWDSVIRRNQSSSSEPAGSGRSGGLNCPIRSKASAGGAPRSSTGSMDSAGSEDSLSEEQKKFDAMIEHEREDALHDDFGDQVIQDDFSDSEKKWG